MKSAMRFKLFAVVMAVAMFAGCASQKPSGKIENVLEAHATITAIDLPQREVTLQDSKDGTIVVEVPQEIENLDRMRVGDEVIVSYTEALAWQVKPAGKGTPGVSEDTSVTAAKPGDKPGGKVGRTVTLTATITGIDLAGSTVTLTGPGGKSKTIKARDPSNLKKVQVGDLVDITYTEAVAVAVQAVAKK